jgi:glycosyltransferase involved in cell wall biosynthesis
VGDRFGGSNVSSLVMAEALRVRGHRPVVIAHGDGAAATEAERRGFEVRRLAPLSVQAGYARPDRARGEQLLVLGPCLAMIRELRLDIVHTNDLTMLRTWALPARVGGAMFIAHWRTALKPSLSVLAALSLADRIISVSSYSCAALPSWAKAKTVVEFNALETFYDQARRQRARAEIRARLGAPPESVLVGVFGSLIRRKRTHLLPEVIRELPATADGRPVYGLFCGGDAEPLDTLFAQKIAAYGLESRIFRTGFVRPSDIWMAGCDVILAPAQSEPLARTVLEAQAIGVPVIVSSDGGLVEIVQDGVTGLVLPPEDLAGWIAATRRILDDPTEAAAMAARGQAAVARLTPELHAQRIEANYRLAYAKRRARGRVRGAAA